MFDKVAGHSPDPEIKSWQQYTLTNIRLRLKELSGNRRSHAYKTLANRGVAAGLMTFIAATGTNLSVALELQLATEKSFLQHKEIGTLAQKGARMEKMFS